MTDAPVVLVDALNVVRSRWPNIREDRFLELTRAWAEEEGVRVVAVFDGRAPDAVDGLSVAGTGAESADDWIVEHVTGAPPGDRLWLVSSDRGLRARVAHRVERVIGGGAFATSLEALEGRGYYRATGDGEEQAMAVTTSERAPEFDLEVGHHERVRLADFRGRSNVLLVFHPFAFTPVCEEEARDLQENLESFRNAQTEIVFVSCDPAPARQAWKEDLGAEFTFASDFWTHGAAAKAYGVFNEENGAPHRGTFLIDKEGTVIWSLVKWSGERRTEMVPESLDSLRG